MLAAWKYIESDFQRDYGIDLTEALPRMSWRRFQTLLNGLSPYGAFAAHYSELLRQQRAEEEQNAATAPASVQSFWAQVTALGAPSGS